MSEVLHSMKSSFAFTIFQDVVSRGDKTNDLWATIESDKPDSRRNVMTTLNSISQTLRRVTAFQLIQRVPTTFLGTGGVKYVNYAKYLY